MNRPSFSNHISSQYQIIDFDGYIKELERYCCFLEWKVENLSDALSDHIKALDKTCRKLAFVSDKRIINELGSFTIGEIDRTFEEWERWAMEDERTD